MTSPIRTDLGGRLRDGRQIQRRKYKEEEQHKLGVLRAGNSGVLTEDGDFTGACPRVSHLRTLGIETDPPTDSRLIMFQMGTANEDVIYNDLIQTKAADEVVLREHEIPIQWATANGTRVTGRPDMVVCRRTDSVALAQESSETPPQFTPVFGVELKGVFSVWTSREVLFDETPKIDNLIQAAHYSWKLGCPFRLMYKQYGLQAVPSWAGKLFPKRGQKNSEHIEYNDKGDIKAIQPYEIVYELEFDKAGFLKYRREGSPKWTKSLVRTQDIERYYEFLSTMAVKKELGARPLTIDPVGNAKNFSKCGYCPLQKTCDSFEGRGYDVWLDEVRRTLTVDGKETA